MNRMHLLYKMDDLLELCKKCERPYASLVTRCKGCNVYDGLREIGANLGRGKQVAKLTLEEYKDFKALGLSDKEIAQKKNMHQQYISQLKKQWQQPSEKPVVIMNQTPKTVTPSKEDKTAEMRQLINELSNSHKEKDLVIQDLQTKIQDLENLNAACSDIESECSSLQHDLNNEQIAKRYAEQEYARVQSELEQKDYDLQNVLIKQAEIYASLIRLEKENKALRDLLKVYI
jgi:uncharacterized protein YnzC (UPF0291/DUF896 family)